MDPEEKVGDDVRIQISAGGGGGGKQPKEEVDLVGETAAAKTEFKQFDTINDTFFTDHHYYYRRQKKFSQQTIERISRECDILRDGLPDSIFVRANKGKPDLLKAVIIGPEGTPHHDGLFFFDIYFPPKFPTAPPKIRSFYVNGLLNLFMPQPHSLWNPSATLLDSLLYIRKSLIKRGGFINRKDEMSSLIDKERISVFNWSTMVDVLDKPPKYFEKFVARHFYDRAVQILTTCKAYISKRVDTVDHPVIRAPWQEEFERMERHYYKLVNAFQKNGSSLDDLSKLDIEFHGEPVCTLSVKVVVWSKLCFVVIGILFVAYGLVRQILDHGLI